MCPQPEIQLNFDVPLTKFSQIFRLGAPILGVVLERPQDKIYDRGSNVQNEMSMILEGATSQVQVVVSYISFYFQKIVLSCIASICQRTCMYFILRNILENDSKHKILDILISSSMQVLDKFQLQFSKIYREMGSKKGFDRIYHLLYGFRQNLVGIGFGTLQCFCRKCAERYMAL